MYLVEGATAGDFDCWVLAMNPDAERTAHIKLTFLTDTGPVPGPEADVEPGRRISFHVDDHVTTYDVSTLVESKNGVPVVAERAMYDDAKTWAHNSVGFGADRTGMQCQRWIKTYGGKEDDRAVSVQQTTEGGYIVAGYTESYGDGSGEAYLIKTDASGELQWQKAIGGSAYDRAESVRQTGDGGYIMAGCTHSYGPGGVPQAYLVKLDASGGVEWERAFGGAAEYWVKEVQQASDGGYVMAGYTGHGDSPNPKYDVFIMKTDGSGKLAWQKILGGAEDDRATAVQQTSDGGYMVAGYTASFGAGGRDFYLAKIDATGNLQWEKSYGSQSSEEANCARLTSDGGCILAGVVLNYLAPEDWDYDVYLVKTDASGNLQWQKKLEGSGNDYVFSVQQTSGGGYVLAGHTTSMGSSGAYLVKTDHSGEILWEKVFSLTYSDWAFSIQQTSDGGYIMAGEADFPNTVRKEVYLIKTDPWGNSG